MIFSDKTDWTAIDLEQGGDRGRLSPRPHHLALILPGVPQLQHVYPEAREPVPLVDIGDGVAGIMCDHQPANTQNL